jgi:predicted nucleic acid-binding protein
MTDLCFVDTNVFLYEKETTTSTKREAARSWIKELWSREAGRISSQVLVEFHANARKVVPGASPDEIRYALRRLYRWNPILVDISLIERAWTIEDRYHISWWDALIVAAAQAAGCAYLLSEDLQDGQRFDGVTIVDPFAHDVATVLG